MQRGLLHLLVLLSGASGLVYQVLWVRALGLHFGIATPAIATVVATFMGGLALGNALLGPRADRSSRPLRLYRWIELGIGVSGLAVSLLLTRAGPALDWLAGRIESTGPGATFTRGLVCAVLMLVPTTLMGGTLPVLMRALFRTGESGRTLGGLYACNTFGAVIGALLPDFWLIPQYGMTAAACVAAAGNLLVAAAVPGAATVTPVLSATERRGPRTRVELVALALGVLSGFAGMALEVLWSRTLSHWTASLATSFSLLLAVYLVALSLGTVLTRRAADRVESPLTVAGVLLALSGVASYAMVAAAPAWRGFERQLVPRPPELNRLALWREAGDALLHAGYLAVPTCLLMGAAFPFVVAAVVKQRAGADTGRLFTLNTAAGVLGSIAAGFVWLPSLGEQDSYLTVAVLLSFLAPLFTSLAGKRRIALLFGLVGAGAVLSMTTVLPRYHLLRSHLRGGGRVVQVREGATTTAAAVARHVYGEPHFMELLTPGVSMASTSLEGRRYMGIMAHSAMLLARRAECALLICYGAGNTARSLLSYPELRALDVVDISPEVLALSRRFARGRDPLRDRRVRVFVDDGRHHLITRAHRYDVITTEPPPPNHAGVANLYSRELYALARQRLQPGGVMTQWLPVFQLSEHDALTMIAAFVAEFPHTALLYGHKMQWVLVGSDAPLRLAGERVAARIQKPVLDDLATSGIADLADFYGGVLQTDAQLRALTARVEPLRDDRPTIQYPWEALGHYARYTDRLQLRADRLQAFGSPESPQLVSEVEAHARAVRSVLRGLRYSGSNAVEHWEVMFGTALQPALTARPGHQGLLELLAIDDERMALAERALGRPGARGLLAEEPSRGRDPRRAAHRAALEGAALDLARRHYYARDYATALSELEPLRPEFGEAARVALLKAGALRALGRSAEAAGAFERAARASRHPEFRRLARELAHRAAEPFAPEHGPFWLAPEAARSR